NCKAEMCCTIPCLRELSLQLEKCSHHLRVEVRACERSDVLARFGFGSAFAIRTLGAHGIPYIDDREDARSERNLLALQAARVATTVPLLMMAIGNVQRR